MEQSLKFLEKYLAYNFFSFNCRNWFFRPKKLTTFKHISNGEIDNFEWMKLCEISKPVKKFFKKTFTNYQNIETVFSKQKPTIIF